MMSNTYPHLRRTNHANPSAMLDAPASTKNPADARMIVVQSGVQIHEVGDRLETVAAHVVSAGSYEHYSVEYPTRTSFPSVLMM